MDPLAGVVYIADREDVAELVRRVAEDVVLTKPGLSFCTFDQVVERTRAAVGARDRGR